MQADKGKKIAKKVGCGACGCSFGLVAFIVGIIYLTVFSNVCARMMGEETYPIKGDASRFDPIAALPEIQQRVGSNAKLIQIDASSVRPDGTLNLNADYSPAPSANFRFQMILDKAPDGKTAPPVGAGRGPDDVWVQTVTVRCYEPGQRRHVTTISGNSRSSYSYTNEGMDIDRGTPSMQKPVAGISSVRVTPSQMWEMARKLGAREDSVASIRIDEDSSVFSITGTGIRLRWDEDGKLQTSGLSDAQKEKLGIKEEELER